MQSPLAADKETVKKYKITAEVEPSPRYKLAFLQEQKEQIRAMHWRARVDVLHATRLSESANQNLADKGLQQRGAHQNEVEQSVGALQMINQLIAELRAEYPEVNAGA